MKCFGATEFSILMGNSAKQFDFVHLNFASSGRCLVFREYEFDLAPGVEILFIQLINGVGGENLTSQQLRTCSEHLSVNHFLKLHMISENSWPHLL